ncbi:MAG: hypothetical protein AABZ12_14020 [Planctomycetota bacterium]
MEPLNGLLLWGGETVQFCWSAMVAAVEWSFHSMAWLLNPLLSPVLSILNPVFTVLGNLVFGVFSFLPRWLGLSVLSVALGIVMVPCFGFLSNQRGISRAKDDIKANLLALKLFKDDLGVAFRCQGRILWAILRLQRYVLVPILCLALPVTMTLGQMGLRYQWRPLQVGESAVVRIALADPSSNARGVGVESPAGLSLEIPPIAGRGDAACRIRAVQPGRHFLKIAVGGSSIDKEVVVGSEMTRVSAKRPGRAWVDQLLHPAESSLPGATGVRSIDIEYPHETHWFHGADWWVLSLFILSMAAAYAVSPVFRVRF